MNTLIIFCATYLIWVEACAALVFFVMLGVTQRRSFALMSLGGLALAYALGKVAGLLWYNPRPFVAQNFTPLVAHAATNGFPSEHALAAFAIAALIWVADRTWGWVFLVIALFVSFGRVLSGVHHVVDVTASAVVAALAVLIVTSILRRFGHSFIREP